MKLPTIWLSAALLALVLAPAGCGGDDDKNGGGSSRAGETDGGAQTASSSGGSDDRARTSEDTKGSSSSGEPDQSGSSGGSRADAAGGSEADKADASDAKAVRETVATFVAGMSEKDGRKVCSTYTRQTRKLVASALATTCPRSMKYSFGIIVPAGFEDSFKRVEVVRVTTSGRKAVAHLKIPKDLLRVPTIRFIARKEQLALRRERGEWRVELLALL